MMSAKIPSSPIITENGQFSGKSHTATEWYKYPKASTHWRQMPRISFKKGVDRDALKKWWKRSLGKHIGKELAIYLILYYALYFVHWFAFKGEVKVNFEIVVAYFKENVSPFARDLAFLLGFYVKTVVSRWWNQFKKLPSPDNIAIQLHGWIHIKEDDQDKELKQKKAIIFIHTTMRYIILSYVLCIKRISEVVKKMFHSKKDAEEYEQMIQSRLVTKEEIERMKEEDGDPENSWWMPLCWAMKIVNDAKNVDGIVFDPKELIAAIVKFKDGLESAIEIYDHVPLPPVYSQVVNIATYSYFALELIGDQELSADPRVGFPFFLVLKFILFIGILNVSRAIDDPLGDDEMIIILMICCPDIFGLLKEYYLSMEVPQLLQN